MLSIFRDPDHGSRKDVRLAHTFNGLTINSPDDDPKDCIQIDRITPQTTVDSLIEPHQNREGSEAWGARKTGRTIQVLGSIRAPTLGRLHDQMKALAAAFDPDLATHVSPDTQGFLPYDFDVPTLDTENYPTGLVPSRYYVRALQVPEPSISYDGGYVAQFALMLFMHDPRRYLQTESTFGAVAGNADNTLADYRSWPSAIITMTGPGNVAATLTNATLGMSLVLNLSGLSAGDVVVVDMEQRFITLNGTASMGLYASGDYWWMSPGVENALALTNTEGIDSWLVGWRPAFCL